MPSAGFEAAIPGIERPQIYGLERTTTGMDSLMILFFSHGSTTLVGLGLFYEVPRSHSDTTQSVGLFWTSHRPVAQTST
jgi:hypothetical protein